MLVGVPVSAPVAAFSRMPGGKDPFVMETLYGGWPPNIPMVALYGWLVIALGRVLVVIASVAGGFTVPVLAA